MILIVPRRSTFEVCLSEAAMAGSLYRTNAGEPPTQMQPRPPAVGVKAPLRCFRARPITSWCGARGMLVCRSAMRGLPVNWLERRARRGLGKEAAERVSAGCYGAVVAASTLAGSADLPNWKLALLVIATNLVYFGTHVFAYAVADPDIEHKHLQQITAHHARIAAPMITGVKILASRRKLWPVRGCRRPRGAGGSPGTVLRARLVQQWSGRRRRGCRHRVQPV